MLAIVSPHYFVRPIKGLSYVIMHLLVEFHEQLNQSYLIILSKVIQSSSD